MDIIENRVEAARNLAEIMKARSWEDSMIVALPRGGVPIAKELAECLEIPWDVLLVKKVGAPTHPEFAIGAIAEDAEPIWNVETVERLGLEKEDLTGLVKKTQKKIKKQKSDWNIKNRKDLFKNKTIIVVDDGLATGLTMKAAVHYLKEKGAKEVITAVPVASQSALSYLREVTDGNYTLMVPENFYSVGQWYKDFSEVTDEEVKDLLYNKMQASQLSHHSKEVDIPAEGEHLKGLLTIAKESRAMIIFAHGSGSSHKSSRNQKVAKRLNEKGFSTLLFDLLTPKESENRENVFDIPLMTRRLQIATQWVRDHKELKALPLGYFGASTGAAAAFIAASTDNQIQSVVSRGGRPDLAGKALDEVLCPSLLLVGDQDFGVIELNAEAKERLVESELVLIHEAGHLFEEPGTMEKVIQYSSEWFENTLIKKEKSLSLGPHELLEEKIINLAQVIRNRESYTPLLEKISHAKIVMLGEATHGTEEFYQLRREISQLLIDDYGFDFVAVEGDWPACYKLNQFIKMEDDKPIEKVMENFTRWPTWMWANESVVEFVQWAQGKDVGFYGLDVYSFYESLNQLKKYGKRMSPKIEKQINETYSCLESFGNEINYARALIEWPEGCEKEVLENLNSLLRMRLSETDLSLHEIFDIQQNAKIVKNAEKYYRSMMIGKDDTWNIRDRHMMDTLEALLRFHGKDSKAIVWAHNTHVGDYHATDMLQEGNINIGGLAREIFGMDQVALVGFGTYEGRVLAGRAWDATPEILPLPSARKGSYEDFFHKVATQLQSNQFYVIPEKEKLLNERKGHRAVGVVYQPVFESHGRNYVPTELANRYDAFIFVDKTSPLRSLQIKTQNNQLSDTWPIGV